MAGMFSNNNDFSWNSNTIFDKIGSQEKREEYLTELSGTGNNEREIARAVQSLTRDEMIQMLHQIPEKEDREDYVKTYLGVKKY
jgi:ABC-type histidine transport system ATPase subunit